MTTLSQVWLKSFKEINAEWKFEVQWICYASNVLGQGPIKNILSLPAGSQGAHEKVVVDKLRVDKNGVRLYSDT